MPNENYQIQNRMRDKRSSDKPVIFSWGFFKWRSRKQIQNQRELLKKSQQGIWERKRIWKRESCASTPPSSLRIPDILPPHASITWNLLHSLDSYISFTLPWRFTTLVIRNSNAPLLLSWNIHFLWQKKKKTQMTNMCAQSASQNFAMMDPISTMRIPQPSSSALAFPCILILPLTPANVQYPCGDLSALLATSSWCVYKSTAIL